MAKSAQPTKKYESKTQKGLFYWAEPTGENSWMVVYQAEGFPSTEAIDDWLANEADADQIAQQLANGVP